MALLVVQHPICHVERVPYIWHFVWDFVSQAGQKWYNVILEWLLEAARSSSQLPYISMEDYETLQRQWMSLFIVHHSIFSSERVSYICHLVWKLRVNLGRNVMIWPISGYDMLPEASLICVLYQRGIMKHLEAMNVSSSSRASKSLC